MILQFNLCFVGDTTVAATTTTLPSTPYVTRDDGLISQILLFFIFAIAAAALAKAIASFTSFCIRRRTRRKKAKQKTEIEEPEINIPLPKGANIKTGLFGIMPASEKDTKTTKKSPSRTKQKSEANTNNNSNVDEVPHCSKTETNLSLPGV